LPVIGLVLQKRLDQPKGTRGLLLAHLGDKLLELLLRGHPSSVDRPSGLTVEPTVEGRWAAGIPVGPGALGRALGL